MFMMQLGPLGSLYIKLHPSFNQAPFIKLHLLRYGSWGSHSLGASSTGGIVYYLWAYYVWAYYFWAYYFWTYYFCAYIRGGGEGGASSIRGGSLLYKRWEPPI